MKELRLTNTNKVALVDDEDYDMVLSHSDKWYSTEGGATYPVCYSRLLIVNGKQRKIYLHRLVLNKLDTDLNLDIDHKNTNKLDNQKSNLRLIEHYLNLHNKPKPKGSTSKYKHVSFYLATRKWQVNLRVKGVSYSGGHHSDEIDAALAANELMKKHLGEFARLNIIDGYTT